MEPVDAVPCDTTGWSCRPIAPADVATSARERRHGLLGREGYRHVLVLKPARQIHTFGMRFAIDVAWCDRSGRVLTTATVPPNRLSAWVFRAHTVLEAEAGAFARLGIVAGERFAFRRLDHTAGTWLVKCPDESGLRHT